MLSWCKFQGYYMREQLRLYNDWFSLEGFAMVIIHWHSLGEHWGNKKQKQKQNCKLEPLGTILSWAQWDLVSWVSSVLFMQQAPGSVLSRKSPEEALAMWLPSWPQNGTDSQDLESESHGPGMEKRHRCERGKNCEGEHTIRGLCLWLLSPSAYCIPELSPWPQ